MLAASRALLARFVSLRRICSASHLRCCRIVPHLDSKIMHGPEYSPRVPLFHPVLPAEVPCSCFIVACPASRAFHSLLMLLEAARLTRLNTLGIFFLSFFFFLLNYRNPAYIKTQLHRSKTQLFGGYLSNCLIYSPYFKQTANKI